jgi:eukaryotic-like serine/threonine-protein kinase
LGKYELLGELGHGAMGVVYRARDPIINRLVALKTITIGVADDPALLQRFYREAQSAGGLQHPNIVTIYDMGEAGNLPYIAMELVEGENLEQVIARRPNLPITLKLVYAMQACRAFDYAHKRGIVHRDIKPGNVMLGKDGVVKVVDFGIARVLEASRTQTGMLIGTFAYMSPEQYHGEHADERSDIWSLGVLLYELLCYERPFKGATPASLMHSICQENPSPLKKFLAECPEELEVIVARVLQKIPNERYQSMEDLLLELDPVCKRLQVQFVADLIQQSRELLEQGEFAQSRDLLRQALEVESGNQQARRLLEKTNAELKRLQNRPNVQQFIDRGRALLQEGKFEEAKGAAESALQLDSTFAPAQELRIAAQHEIERARMREEALEAAKQRMAEGMPEEAEMFLAKVLQVEPANEQALALQKQVDTEKAERQHRARLLESLRHARELWTQQNYRECIQLLVELKKAYPGEEEISRLLESAREDQIEQQKQQSLLESRNLLASSRYEECLALLHSLQKAFPNDEEIPRLLEEAHRDLLDRRKLQKLTEARSLLAAGQYQSCISLLTSACKEFPEDSEFPKLLDTARQSQTEQRRQQGISDARKHFAARRFEKCLSALAALENDFPGDDEILKLHEAVREEQAQERKQRRLQEARDLLEAKEYKSLLTLLASLQAEFPAEDEVQQLLESAHKEQIEQRKRECMAEARKFLAARQYDESAAVLQKLQAEFPAETEIRRLLQSTLEEQSEHRKQECLIEARSLLRAKRYVESIAVLEKLHVDFPAETEIRKQLAIAREELAEQEKQKQLSEGRNLLAARSFGEALTLLNALAKTYPKDAAVLKLRTLAQREQEEHAKAERIQGELDALKKLMGERKYPEVLTRTQSLLAEFPGEANFVRLAEFATSQQAQIEKEILLRATLGEAKSYFATNRFEEAIRAAKIGLQHFPGNAELANLSQQAETQQRKLEIRQQIEMRIREIRVKINREKFSEAVDLAKETLVTLGPDTDLTQLLNSAQVEIEAREQKRKQERTIGTIRTLMDSGDFEAATLAVEEALKRNDVESFDPRIQRLSREIENGKLLAEQKLIPSTTPTEPRTLSREYAFLEAPPIPSEPAPAEASSAPQASAAQASTSPSSVTAQFLPPSAPLDLVTPESEAFVEPPPLSAQPPIEVHDVPAISAARSETGKGLPLAEEPEDKIPASSVPGNVRIWRKPVVLGVMALGLVAAVWSGVHFMHPKVAQVPGPPINTKPEPATAKSDPLELQQREALDNANKLVAANDLNGARQTLQQASALNGPLTSEILKKQSEIEASMKDVNLRQLRQTEEKLWQRAMNRTADGHFAEAQNDLRQVLALPAGGVHRDDAQNYLQRVIPQRVQQNGLMSQARQALKVSDFQSARQAASQLKQIGGASEAVVAEIDQQEQAKLAQLESQFNQLKQRDDDAAVQQLRALQPKFQALASDGGPQSGEASNYASAVPGAITEMQASIQKKSMDAAFQRTVQKYQQAASASDRNGLAAARTDLQSIIQGGGLHADEAQRLLADVNDKLAALNQPPVSPAKPSLRPETPPVVSEDADAGIRAAIRRYSQAFEQKDADALRKIWPNMGDKYSSYRVAFESALSIRMRVDIANVDLSSDRATAVVTGQVSQDYTPKGSKTRTSRDAVTFHLAKANGAWIIMDVH